MKVAVCFFGLPRSYEQWKDKFGKFYEGCEVDFYAHFWKDSSFNQEDLNQKFNFKKLLVHEQKKDFIKLPKITDLTKTTKGVFSTLSPLFSMKMVGEIIEEIEEDYDFFIITRTDVGCNSNTKLIDFELDCDKFYTSYVRGNEWLNTHLDAKWLCGNKKKISELCSVYDNLTKYIVEDKIPLCHHRLFFHALKEYKDSMEMLNVDPSYSLAGGWFFMRNGRITKS